jgi:hypothetical protein
MLEAIKLIVDGYVKLSARKALDDLKAHRRRLAAELRQINGTVDLSSSIRQLETEIEIIEEGLEKLDARRPAGLGRFACRLFSNSLSPRSRWHFCSSYWSAPLSEERRLRPEGHPELLPEL